MPSPHDRCRTDRHFDFLRSQFHCAGDTTTMQIGTKITLRNLPVHRRCDTMSDHETAQVSAAGLTQESLNDEIGIEAAKRLDHTL